MAFLLLWNSVTSRRRKFLLRKIVVRCKEVEERENGKMQLKGRRTEAVQISQRRTWHAFADKGVLRTRLPVNTIPCLFFVCQNVLHFGVLYCKLKYTLLKETCPNISDIVSTHLKDTCHRLSTDIMVGLMAWRFWLICFCA